ncbi:hypothetical protein N0824_01564 [Microcystis sp. 0824]|nr:hypothetical protein N0824_01564 [Microcystis sp. 0824]
MRKKSLKALSNKVLSFIQQALNNRRLFVQTLCYFNLLKPWLFFIFIPQIIRLFCRLFSLLNK